MAITHVLLAFVSFAAADTVTLTTGAKMKGLVLEQGAEQVKLQVDEEGFVELSTPTVASVVKESEAANEKIRSAWAADKRKAEAVEDKAERFAQVQRAKGLVLYEGDWMSAKEAEVRLKRREQDHAAHGKNGQVFIASEAQPTTPTPQSRNTMLLSYVPLQAPVGLSGVSGGGGRGRRGRRSVTVFQDGKVVFSSDKRGD